VLAVFVCAGVAAPAGAIARPAITVNVRASFTNGIPDGAVDIYIDDELFAAGLAFGQRFNFDTVDDAFLPVKVFTATPNPPAHAPGSGALFDDVLSWGQYLFVSAGGGAARVVLLDTGTVSHRPPPKGVARVLFRNAAPGTVADLHLGATALADHVRDGRATLVESTPAAGTLRVTNDADDSLLTATADVVLRAGWLDEVYLVANLAGSTHSMLHISRSLGSGYRFVASDGGVFAFGSRAFLGSAASLHLTEPIVGAAETATGAGYWLVASDGGVFAFGDAHFFGSMAHRQLAAPIVGIAPTTTGKGYWLVASDGGVFAFGDAHFYGSAGALHLVQPVTALARTTAGTGYWLLGADGGVFTFGEAQFYASAAGVHTAATAVALLSVTDRDGYAVVFADGATFDYFDSAAYPYLAIPSTPTPIAGARFIGTGDGAWSVTPDGRLGHVGSAGTYGDLFGIMLQAPIVALI
jgi:hypothetical protein